MSDTYSADPQEETAPGDAAEPGEASEPGEGEQCPTCGQTMPADEASKQSQQAVNYRQGNPQRSCGLCGNFDSKNHGCDTVDGDISAFGYCDIYVRQDNPFREGETEAFQGGTPVTTPAPAEAPDPGLRIGRQGYGGGA